ncbi:hypothetical protein [Mariniblastus fucicola]|uniref:Secreted protein n=1 Tax=Mariniblastus fucicola TaxID=980251 RepID=A0A5B9P4Y3_9BACT|nr:hypothetical protein [Mariniblastus fucicola]QEG21458.1 hypothetical protein MFFC18_13140 [Mariniblastus fucicola]
MRLSNLPILLIAIVCFGHILCQQANGQTSASQFYRVTVNEGISLHSPGDVLISHDLTDNNQVFPEQPWVAYTSNMNGASVDFTIGKFIHEDYTFFRRNSIINLRVIDSSPSANWTATVPNGQTSGYFFGNQTATVSAESDGSGEGILGITVSFDEFYYRFLASGRYNATVVGTITNK